MHVSPSPGTREIQLTTAALAEAVNAADVPRLLALWWDDGVLMPPGHPAVQGRAAIETYFARLFVRRRFHFVLQSLYAEVANEVAYERVAYSAESWPAQSGSAQHSPVAQHVGKGIHIYRRGDDGHWRLAVDVWNSDLPDGVV